VGRGGGVGWGGRERSSFELPWATLLELTSRVKGIQSVPEMIHLDPGWGARLSISKRETDCQSRGKGMVNETSGDNSGGAERGVADVTASDRKREEPSTNKNKLPATTRTPYD